VHGSGKARDSYYRFSSRRSSKSLFSKNRSAPQHLFHEQKKAALALSLAFANNVEPRQTVNQQQRMDESVVGMDVELSADAKQQQQEAEDLEMICFGPGSSETTTTESYHNLIKDSLDQRDSSGKNFIGDGSSEHVLPVLTCMKHDKLNCISPQTVNII
jgi:hypothetical protein